MLGAADFDAQPIVDIAPVIISMNSAARADTRRALAMLTWKGAFITVSAGVAVGTKRLYYS